MDSIVNKLNNRYVIAVMVLLFVVGVVRRFIK
jgi:hypothetical protein